MKNTSLIFTLLLSMISTPLVSAADMAPLNADKFGIIEKVPATPGPHWLWLYDTNFIAFSDGRAHLVDGDTGRYFGSPNTFP